ncbi:MAG: RNA pyrophosphohydrolase [Rhodospirillales bacterium]|jgi:putative (di)nucleoside polyphosphate hydrolase
MSLDDDYRMGVGIVLLNQLNQVFVAKRIDTPSAWQMPQGGIDKGEAPHETVMRELTEEIGTDRAEIIAETKDWLIYDLPEGLRKKVWGGKYKGQKQKWFAMRFTGTDTDIDLTADKHPEFSEWKWTSMDQLVELIVPFKRPLYENIVREFRYLAKME